MRIGIPFILQFVASIAGQFCPGERVSSFSCTTELTQVWSGTALAGQCPSNNPNDVITLSSAFNLEGDTVLCGIFTTNVTNITPIMGGNTLLSSTISFTASSDLDGTEVVCWDGNQAEVQSYPITIIGPPTAPDITMVNFTPRVVFIIMWDGTAVVSDSAVTGFQVNSPSGIMCADTSSSPSAMESRCTWEPSAVGQTPSICVSAINCGSQQGASDCVSVNLQVPVAPTLTACPVYDQSGPLLRIESSCTTVPAVVIADGVDGSPDAYIFSYNDGDDSVIPSGQCTGGTCTDEFTPDPAVSQYTVSVTARNVVGEGPPDTAGPIITINDILQVMIAVNTRTVQCRFLGGFTGTAECQIEYSTQEDLSGSVVDTGSSSSGDTVTVTLTATLERSSTYYFLITATAPSVTVRVQGFFKTDCLFSDLVQGMDVQLVTEGCDSRFVGGVMTAAGTGRVCYNGTATGSLAVYACNCPSLYTLVGTGTRTCLSDGTWSGTVPQCLPECAFIPDPPLSGGNDPMVACSSTSSLIAAEYGCSTTHFSTPICGTCQWPEAPTCPAGLSVGAAVGITAVLTFLVAFSAGLLVAFAIAYRYIQKQKGQYSPRDPQQPTPTQASISLQQGNIELKDNICYGPVPSQPPAPLHRAPMYEEVATHVQPGSMEMKANVAYGPISH